MIIRQMGLPVALAVTMLSGLPAHQTGFFHQSSGLVTTNVFTFTTKQ
nr:hypothetical protein [Klebsiella oxytoca]